MAVRRVGPPPEIAHVITVRRLGFCDWSLQIDGREFPWAVSADGVDVTVADRDMPAVRLTIVADRVEVVDDVNEPTPPPPVWWRRVLRLERS